ncbi:hypothetical protein SteCoe_28852 [Stentor coeruleus]|uniref:RING-type domain-containing protein n=1 Tax=Stentor coeruleus TaxID=5963 RepID=A0A1R2B7D4_9CILI|nr:hypothetical protein SteCoe_28852 [Stentor coeruleus]
MGCWCCKGEAQEYYQPLLISRSETIRKFNSTTSTINTSKLSDNFSNNVKLLKDLGEAMKRGIEESQNTSNEFVKSLESIDFHFCRKHLEQLPSVMNELECPGCLMLYNTTECLPLRLSCRHPLCKSCAFSAFSESKKILCPQDSIVTLTDPEDLAIKRRLLSKVEAFEEQLLCSTHFIKHEKFCFDCKIPFCPVCSSEHQGHSFDLIDSSKVTDELNKWGKDLNAYEDKLKETQKKIEVCRNSFIQHEKNLRDETSNHIEKLKQNREKVIKILNEASDEHIQRMESGLNEIIDSMPKKKINQYEDSIKEEIIRTEEMKDSWMDLKIGEKLAKLRQADLKSQKKFDLPNIDPWKTVYNSLQMITDFESLSLVLASVQNNSTTQTP